MSKEVELKFRVDDLSPARRGLKNLGAKLLWSGKEENWFFDTKTRFLLKENSTLRIKRMGDTKLALKRGSHVRRGVKVAEEIQTEIGDAKKLRTMLEHLGFKMRLYYSKKREHWKLKNSYIELDELSDGRKFVEIEGSHKSIRSVAEKLNLDFAKSNTKSYTQILRSR